jgi:hypothetical protein
MFGQSVQGTEQKVNKTEKFEKRKKNVVKRKERKMMLQIIFRIWEKTG